MTKIHFLQFFQEDADRKGAQQSLLDRLVDQGQLKASDIVMETHCMHPAFLQTQLDLSLKNLCLETLDLYYLHNPAETQLALLGEDKFMHRLAKSFEFLERQISEKKIRNYGLATSLSFRAPIDDEGVHLSLMKVTELAEKVAGKGHGLRFVQVPINTIMFEAMWQESQAISPDYIIRDVK